MSSTPDIELKPVNSVIVDDASARSSSGGQRREVVLTASQEYHLRDNKEMNEFGKIQQLKRRFGLLSMVGFTCILTCTWEALLCVFAAGLANGGPAGLIYGYIFSWVGILCVVASIGELASMMPLSGGQYFWVYYIAPPSCRTFISYLTGWINVLGWQSGTTSLAFLSGTMIQGLITLNYPNYVGERWHGTLLLYAVIAITIVVNTYLANHMPKIEGLIFILHMVGFFGILIPIVYLAPHGTAKDVFTLFLNEGGWGTQGLSFFVGITTSVFSFLGADSACHMAEEIEGASTIIPWAMLSAIVINGALGFGMLIAILFCAGDLERVLGTATGFPFIEIFYQATDSIAGSTAMTALIVALVIFGAAACFTTSSRMMWAFARDNGLPFSEYLKRVEPRTQLPLYSIGASCLINLLLALINVGSTAALNAVTSLVVAGLFISYLITISLMLNRRLRPDVEASQLRWGPWKMGKWSGAAVNAFAIIYVTISTVFSFFPPTPEVTAESMNYSVVVFVGVIVFGIVRYFISGRKTFTGPVIETEEADLAGKVKELE